MWLIKIIHVFIQLLAFMQKESQCITSPQFRIGFGFCFISQSLALSETTVWCIIFHFSSFFFFIFCTCLLVSAHCQEILVFGRCSFPTSPSLQCLYFPRHSCCWMNDCLCFKWVMYDQFLWDDKPRNNPNVKNNRAATVGIGNLSEKRLLVAATVPLQCRPLWDGYHYLLELSLPHIGWSLGIDKNLSEAATQPASVMKWSWRENMEITIGSSCSWESCYGYIREAPRLQYI